ncbi:hypothetical protein ACFO7V_14980, partial [Glutamicibacter bergerei]
MTFQEMAVSAKPAAEVSIDRALVRELICAQASQWSGRTLTYLATGWDNEVYRLGDDLLVRLPRRALAEKIGHKERKWLPGSAEGLVDTKVYAARATDSIIVA